MAAGSNNNGLGKEYKRDGQWAVGGGPEFQESGGGDEVGEGKKWRGNGKFGTILGVAETAD